MRTRYFFGLFALVAVSLTVVRLAIGQPIAPTVLAGDFKTFGTAPAVSSCGTSPAVTSGSTDTAGEVTVGTATPTSCTVTWATARTNAPFCVVVNETNNLAAFTYASGTTTLVVTQTATSSDKFVWLCVQH